MHNHEAYSTLLRGCRRVHPLKLGARGFPFMLASGLRALTAPVLHVCALRSSAP